MKPGFSLALALLAFASCSRETGLLGAAVSGAVVPVVAIEKIGTDSPVIVQGTMTKKCPVAGCWFTLQDQTGTIKVDTKSAGFVVVDVPLHSKLTVAGRVSTNGAERFIDATGVRF